MGIPLPKATSQSITVTGTLLSSSRTRCPTELTTNAHPADNRTGKTVEIPITNNSIPATAFKALSTATVVTGRAEDEVEAGLRVYDPGELLSNRF